MNQSFHASRDVIIRTPEWGAAVAFYATTLGFPEVYRGDCIVGFDAGAFRLYVEKGNTHGPVFEYLVADVQMAKLQLISAGCEVVEEDASVPRCYVRDPYGMTFNIGQASNTSLTLRR
jgi:catechol 2,3-dioxygenase-like lactoylglutathione lyase family enzyme